MAGRKTKLTPELIEQLVTVFTGGCTIKDACAYVGISEPVYYLWLAIGNACLNGEDHPQMPRKTADRERYIEFLEAITRARSVMRVEAVALIRQAAKGRAKQVTHSADGKTIYEYEATPPDWRAAAWLAERSDPANWGRQTTVKGEMKIDVNINIEVVTRAWQALEAAGKNPEAVFNRLAQEAERVQ